jgi:hypothetical protein
VDARPGEARQSLALARGHLPAPSLSKALPASVDAAAVLAELMNDPVLSDYLRRKMNEANFRKEIPMLGNDQSPILRRAEAASAALDKAAANPANPFEMLSARREAEMVVSELKKVVDDDRALALFKVAQSQPLSVFEASPGAVPRSFPESSNAGSSPSGRPSVVGSAGSIISPKTVQQNYSGEERRMAALNGQALPDGSHVIKNSEDLAASFVSWAQSGKPEGALKEHFRTRAHAIGAEAMLPSDFRGTAKLGLATLLRKN